MSHDPVENGALDEKEKSALYPKLFFSKIRLWVMVGCIQEQAEVVTQLDLSRSDESLFLITPLFPQAIKYYYKNVYM